MTRVLVTGAGGFIGGHLVARFAAAPGFEVVGVFHKSPTPPPAQPVATARADLTDEDQCIALMRDWRPDAVVHAAGVFGASDAEARRVNEGAGRSLLEGVARECPRAHVVVLGSAAEYGLPADERPMREDRPCDPTSAYGRAKLAVTEAAMDRARRGDVRACVLRPFNVVGPGIGKQLPLGAFLDRLAHSDRRDRRPVVRMGPIDAIRDFVAVDDVVRAVERVLARGIAGEIVNVCSGTGRTVRELIARMTALAGAEVAIDSSAATPGTGDKPIIGDPGKCRALLGFAPTTTLDSALMAAWAQAMARSDEGAT